MILNRRLQLKMLETLSDHYPDHAPNFTQQFKSEPDFIPNLHYLKEHDFLAGEPERKGGSKYLVNVRITKNGLDFLADDGGIGAMLRTVTVKLDADQFREILAAKVHALAVSDEKKASMLSKLRDLPAEILNRWIMKVVDKGIDSFSEWMDLLQSSSPGSSAGLPPGTV
jgi:hypothetical protein